MMSAPHRIKGDPLIYDRAGRDIYEGWRADMLEADR